METNTLIIIVFIFVSINTGLLLTIVCGLRSTFDNHKVLYNAIKFLVTNSSKVNSSLAEIHKNTKPTCETVPKEQSPRDPFRFDDDDDDFRYFEPPI